MKVRHPTFPDVVIDVIDAGPWLAQGWLEPDTTDDTTGTDPAGETVTAPAAPAKSKKKREASDGE